MEEHFFLCPYCWETISMLMDPSSHDQQYIEDCEVCCNPMEINVKFQENELVLFEVKNLGQ